MKKYEKPLKNKDPCMNTYVNKPNEIVESSVVNDIIKSSTVLTKYENLLIDYVLANTDFDSIGETDPIELQVNALIKAFGIKSGEAYGVIKKAIDNFYYRSIVFKDDTCLDRMRWVWRVSEYLGEKGEGSTVKLYFSPEIIRYLKLSKEHKKPFTQYYLDNVKGFKSGYSFKLYQLIIQYQNTKQQSRTIDLEDLRFYFGTGDKYKTFDGFHRRVLQPAVKEINEKSNINVTAITNKTGKTVTSITFDFELKSDKPNKPKAQAGHRIIHGVFEESLRGQWKAGSHEEEKWARDNWHKARMQMVEAGMIADGPLMNEYALARVPAPWLKVIIKYNAIFNKGLAKLANDVLNSREN